MTSAALCDAVVASETATFSTPFAALGLVPEGCSSVHFERAMGGSRERAERMLGPEGWRPTAREAKEAGLVTEVVPRDQVGKVLWEAFSILQGDPAEQVGQRDWFKIWHGDRIIKPQSSRAQGQDHSAIKLISY